MTHQEIIDREIVEAYVRGKLPPHERRAFQEHLFECDECFAQAQNASRTVAQVRYAGSVGALGSRKPERASRSVWGSGWWRPVLVCAVAASVVAVVLVSVWLSRSRSSPQPSDQRQAQTGTAGSNQAIPAPTVENQIASTATPPRDREQPSPSSSAARPGKDLMAQATNPRVLLESTRSSGAPANEVIVPTGTTAIVLMIPLPPDIHYEGFELQILDKTKARVGPIMRPKPNREGTLIVSVPASQLQPGDYLIKLHSRTGAKTELLGEYGLRVVSK